MQKYFPLLLWILAFEAISFAIGMATQGDVSQWYATLTPPPLTPPNIAFPVMWTILYALIASAGWVLWTSRHLPGGRERLTLFALYMALNWSWTFIFFTAHLMLTGFLWIVLLDIVAIALIAKSWRDVRPASLLMIPPTLWTCFAAYLNGGYWWLN